jgi:hypothetical protein
VQSEKFRFECDAKAEPAIPTLLKTMIDPDTPASVRVRAAEGVFVAILQGAGLKPVATITCERRGL